MIVPGRDLGYIKTDHFFRAHKLFDHFNRDFRIHPQGLGRADPRGKGGGKGVGTNGKVDVFLLPDKIINPFLGLSVLTYSL